MYTDQLPLMPLISFKSFHRLAQHFCITYVRGLEKKRSKQKEQKQTEEKWQKNQKQAEEKWQQKETPLDTKAHKIKENSNSGDPQFHRLLFHTAVDA